jgi:hypothetical protein
MKHQIVCIVALLALGACAAEDLDSESSAAAVPLTKRQAAEILSRASAQRTWFCYNRDSHGAGRHVADENATATNMSAEFVHAYCAGNPAICAADGYPGAELCQPRNCDESSGALLEAVNACAASINDDSSCVVLRPPFGCFYSILGMTTPSS